VTHMLVRNRVKDYDHWRQVFDANRRPQDTSGLRLTKMWRGLNDPNNVFFLLEVSDMGKAKQFVASPESAQTGQEAGVIDGELYYVNEVEA
jgi:hypothetical protein